jgi:nitrate/TMAO reductase-like tetraheme cytochrome c subunit
MSGHDRIALRALFLVGAVALFFLYPAASPAAKEKQKENSCVHCHSRLPGTSFVGTKSHSWTGSIHQKHGVTCDNCHGGDPTAADKKKAHASVLGSRNERSPVYYKNIPANCGRCHGAEFFKFAQSLHYKQLESTGRGPECVTCHGSMVTRVLAPDTIAAVCEQCHNERLALRPYVPQEAKAVLLLLRASASLLDADEHRYHPAPGTAQARYLDDARSGLAPLRPRRDHRTPAEDALLPGETLSGSIAPSSGA